MNSAGSRPIGFKRHLRAEVVPAEAVYLIAERGVTALSGPQVLRLAPLLDGTRDFDQLIRDLGDELPFPEVEQVLSRLFDAGFLEYRRRPVTVGLSAADAGQAASAAALWSAVGLDAESAARAVAAAQVTVIALNHEDEPAALDACREAGLTGQAMSTDGGQRSGDDDGSPGISLVLCDDYLDPRLLAVNDWHLTRRRPWLLAKPSGAEVWIGPVFTPGTGPCWHCLASRLERNQDAGQLLRRVLGSRAYPAAPRAVIPASRAAALRFAVLDIVNWLAGVRGAAQDAISTLDVFGFSGRQQHPVRSRPQCPRCGDPGMMTARMSRPPAAAGSTAAASAAALDSGVLASGPTRILQEYGHLIDPLTGLVPELRREPSSDQFQYAFGSGPNRTIRASTLDELKARARVHSGGRGVTEDEAKAGALCEAIERHCGTRHGDEVVISGTYRDLADEAIHPAACLLFDQRQYAERSEWNGAHPAFHRVPAPFDESAVIEWTPVWSLATGERRLLPTSMLYYCAGPVPGSASVLADSNGCAAGASMPDAIVRGFLELVERDAVALWWYNQTRQPAVPLSAFDDPWIAGLTRRYRTLGRDIWLLDVTSDLGIPVLVAVSRRVDGGAQDIVLGFGAHPDPQVAARRALTEAGQLLGQFSDPAGLAAWRSAVTVARQPCLLPDESAQPTLCIPALCTPTTGRESGQPGTLSVADLTSRARNTGLDVFVLDQTRPDIGLPVARVIVPGLRHFWPRFAPGRLYDVPVRLGRLARPTEYAALNPCPLPT